MHDCAWRIYFDFVDMTLRYMDEEERWSNSEHEHDADRTLTPDPATAAATSTFAASSISAFGTAPSTLSWRVTYDQTELLQYVCKKLDALTKKVNSIGQCTDRHTDQIALVRSDITDLQQQIEVDINAATSQIIQAIPAQISFASSSTPYAPQVPAAMGPTPATTSTTPAPVTVPAPAPVAPTTTTTTAAPAT
ncbi:hypothetical protein FRC09_000392 [Ceratobasidium sp. 395]|nr:hypothetical protein FRC09_000392 [Ceratobasidium sp. 395]